MKEPTRIFKILFSSAVFDGPIGLTWSAHKLALATLLVIFFTSQIQAVPPLHPEDFPSDHLPFCRVNEDAMNQRMAVLKAAPSPQFAALISPTTYNVIVLRVDFSDNVMTQTQAQANDVMTNVKNFYWENSYGLLSATATIPGSTTGGQGAFRMPQPLSYYANGSSSKYAELTKDATAAADTAVNFSSYDHIMIYHAGKGAETGQANTNEVTGNIWSAYAPSGFLGGPTADGKTFPGATFVPESEFQSIDPLGVIVHEYGHQLGLPDLYKAPGQSAVGSWSLMDAGAYLPNPPSGGFLRGGNPAHLDAWSKLSLGVSSPQTISFSEGSVQTLTQAETSHSSFIRLPIVVSSVQGEGSNEYFLLEYRRSGIVNGAAYDKFLPGIGGLLIWHVDDSIANNLDRLAANNINSGTPHLGVDLVEAGTTDASLTEGSIGDPWPGTTGLTFESEKSKAFNGNKSGITVSNISGVGSPSISLKVISPIQKVPTSGSVGIGGGLAGYTNLNNSELVRITLRPQSSGSVSLKIYSLNGDLVYEHKAEVTAGGEPTVTWDGKKNSGETVPSGIYILHSQGGGIESKNKIAILR